MVVYNPHARPRRHQSDLDQEQAREKLRALWPFWEPGHPCPCCGRETWTFAPELVQVTYYGELNVGEIPVYPCVMVICRTCGYTRLFNAKVLGLADG